MRAGRVLLATLVLVLGLLLPGVPESPAAAAGEPHALVSITLDSFTPSLPQRGSTITVTGHVHNTSKKPLLRPRAYFWRNQAPITDREGLEQALGSVSNDPIGARYIPSFDDLYPSPDEPYLAPGATVAFTLKVKVSDLALPPTSGIYLMGVHVLSNEEPLAVGRARVFVPVLSRLPRNVLQMTSIVMLNSRPSLVCASCSPTHRAVLLDHHLADEVAPGGRLDRLLSAAAPPDSSFAVDPALVEELSAMSAGYQIQGDSGPAGLGPGRADAQVWLRRFGQLKRTRDGYRLAYGSVDVAALTHAGQQEVLRASAAAARNVALTASLPLLVWPANGAADAPTLAAAESLSPKAVLLSDTVTRASAPLLQGPGTAPIVNYTSTAFAGGPGPQPSNDPVHLQQRLLADSWLQAATAPAGTTLGRVRVVASPAQAAGANEAIKAPWVKAATLTQLIAATPTAWSQQLLYGTAYRDRELSGASVAAIGRLSQSWATWQDLLVDPAAKRATAAAADAAVARAASVRLRQNGQVLRSYLAPQQRQLDDRLNAVEISVTRKVLTPKTRVSFPVTIRNTLPASADPTNTTYNAIRVRLDFASANRQRLTVQTIPLATIAAGQNLQQPAVVDARTNGTVQVTAQLHTASGLPVGRPVVIDVRATQAGTVGWFIAIGAGIVLVGTTALRIRQVTRERARAAAGTSDTSPAEEVLGEPPAREAELAATRSAPAEQPTPPDSPATIDV